MIAESGNIIDYHIGIREHGAHMRKEHKTKWSAEGCESSGSRVMTTGAIHSGTTLKISANTVGYTVSR